MSLKSIHLRLNEQTLSQFLKFLGIIQNPEEHDPEKFRVVCRRANCNQSDEQKCQQVYPTVSPGADGKDNDRIASNHSCSITS